MRGVHTSPGPAGKRSAPSPAASAARAAPSTPVLRMLGASSSTLETAVAPHV
jgi:hypothetical protein